MGRYDTHKNSLRIPLGKQLLERPRRRCEIHNRMDLSKIGSKDDRWTEWQRIVPNGEIGLSNVKLTGPVMSGLGEVRYV
jgi:hypothetical protein